MTWLGNATTGKPSRTTAPSTSGSAIARSPEHMQALRSSRQTNGTGFGIMALIGRLISSPPTPPTERDESGRFTSTYRRKVRETVLEMRANMPERDWKPL